MNIRPMNVIDAVWGTFCVVWVVAALRSSPVARRQSTTSRLAQIAPLTLGYFLLFYDASAVGPLALRFVSDSPRAAWPGAVIAALGVGFAIAARFVLGKNWSGRVTVKQGHELIRTGPYAVVRHPIYSGMLLGILGTAIVVGEVRGLVGLALAALGLRLKSLQEENFMEEEFGNEYLDYKEHTRAIIPLVW